MANPRRASTLLSHYLDRIGNYPLLTAAQEIELARQIQRGLADDATPGERRRGKRAQDRMILSNLRLVVVAAKEHLHKCSSFDLDDLIQLGNLGLAHAARKFDPERGYKFSTYSRQWIHSYIRRGIINNDPMIRIPDHTYYKYMKVKHLVSPQVGVLEACEKAGLREQDRAHTFCAAAATLSLNSHVDGDGERSEVGDLIPQGYDEDQAERLSSIRDILATLPYDQQKALAYAYGLNGTTKTGIERVGKKFGLSIWHGRQLLRRAERAVANNPDAQQLCGRTSGAKAKPGDVPEAG